MLYSHTFYFGFPDVRTLRHEMGHGLGLHHALGYTTPPSYCDKCDPADPLGGGGHTPNGPHMERLQWISPAQVQTITQDGTYLVTPLEVNDGRVKLLKVNRPLTDFGQGEFIGSSYRQPIGTYNTTMHAGLTGGVSVHVVSVAAGSGAIHTMMVNNPPESPGFYNDAALTDGGCLYDKLNRLLIRQVSHVPGVDGSVDINVQFDADNRDCVRPTVPVAPAPTSPPTGCVPKGKSGKCR